MYRSERVATGIYGLRVAHAWKKVWRNCIIGISASTYLLGRVRRRRIHPPRGWFSIWSDPINGSGTFFLGNQTMLSDSNRPVFTVA